MYTDSAGFGRYTPPGAASGVVFDDVNRNEQFVRANARGEYRLDDLEIGPHRIGVTPVEGLATTTRASLAVLVAGSGRVMRAHF